MLSSLYNYILLTKPRIMLLVLLTGAAALFVEGRAMSDPTSFLLVLLGLYLISGSANSLNQYFEREIDARMSRTRERRPLPLGRLRPCSALAFAVTIGTAGVGLFALVFNLLSAALALFTVLFYGLFYTLWLKPRTPLNIVIGGAAGAMAPVIAWSAVTGTLGALPVVMALIIFLWTPPHFWALALFFKEDYRAAGLPMLPVVRGDRVTLNRIFLYTLVLVAVSLGLILVFRGVFYPVAALALGGVFLRKSWITRRKATPELQRGLFAWSILYLFGIFIGLIADGMFGFNIPAG